METDGIFTWTFWKNTTERVVRTFAGTSIVSLGLGTPGASVFNLDWKAGLGLSLATSLMSLLFALAGSRVGNSTDPSFLK